MRRRGRQPCADRTRCPAPTSSGYGCPRRRRRSAAWFSSFHVLDGEAHPKRAAVPRLAFHPDAAPVRLDDHPGLKHADAESLLLRALEGTEQGVLEERRAHPAAIVGDGENDA